MKSTKDNFGAWIIINVSFKLVLTNGDCYGRFYDG